MRVCVKSLPAPRTSGELPGPFSHFLLGAAGGGKSQSAPSLLSPGKGVMRSRRTNSLNSTRQTYIHGHTQTQKLMTVLFQSASHSQVSGDQRHSVAGPPNPSAVRSRPGSTPSLPSALSAWGVGASRQPGGTQPSRWGRPRINLLPARGPKASEGHDGSAPRVHVSQHRLIAADLPRLCGFRPALLSLGFLPAAHGAFP